jgi:exonuclease III
MDIQCPPLDLSKNHGNGEAIPSPCGSNNNITVNKDQNHTKEIYLVPDTGQEKINILVWNIRGLHDKVFEKSLQNFLFTHDIIFLTEVHTTKNDEEKYSTIPNFIYKNFPRKYIHPQAPGPSGGIGIFIKTNIVDGIELSSVEECIVWLTLKSTFFGGESDRHIACIYFSPEDSTYLHSTNVRSDYFNILNEQISNKLHYKDIIICGDLNARTAKLSDAPETIPGNEGGLESLTSHISQIGNVENVLDRQSCDHTVNNYGKNLIQFCKNTGLRIMNGRLGNISNTCKYTCLKENGASVVDYVLCRPDSMPHIADLVIHPKLIESDHTPIYFALKIGKKQTLKDTSTGGKTIRSFKWDPKSETQYKAKLKGEECMGLQEELVVNTVSTKVNSDELCEIYYDFLNSAIKGNFKQKSANGTKKFPQNNWFNDDCKAVKKAVNDYAKYNDISIAPHCGHYRALEYKYNRVIQLHKRRYQQNIRDDLETLRSQNPQAFWKFWHSLDIGKVNNSRITLSEFNRYFENQVKPPAVNYFDKNHMKEVHAFINHYQTQTSLPDDYPNLSDEICNGVISKEEIMYHVEKLKNNKASGVDGICCEFLKYASKELSDILFCLYNYIFEKGDWPTIWSEGLINPVYKKGSINVTDNYRKITVMPAAGKVLESILNYRLTFRNVALNTDDPCQFGFKKNSLTTDNIFILNSLIQKQRYKKKPVYVCFMDFTKAFDYVDRAALYYKLIKRGIKGKLLNLICNMYSKAKCRVKWKNKVGEKIDSEYGVLQGGMLSPKLFTEFLYDLQNYLHKESGVYIDTDLLTYILFADDLILCSETPEGLQKLIDGLYKFCSKWHLIVSLTKTNIVIFGARVKNHDHIFKYNNQIIEITKEYKYVGTIFTSNAKDIFKKNYPNLCNKAEKAIFALNAYVKNSVGHLQPSLAFKSFDSQISPILEYASEIWYRGKQTDCIEKVHLNYLKNKLHVKPSTATNAIYAECGRFPLVIKQKVQVIKYWQRILSMSNEYIVRKAYNSLYESHQRGQVNWSTHIRDILVENNLALNWEEQTIDNCTLNILKENLYKSFMNTSMMDIHDSDKFPKLRTFKQFKNEFKFENYLNTTKNINHALALCRFRISSHNLRIETGRYTRPKTPPELRTCLHCSSQAVENEEHFLLQCSLYNKERLVLLNVVNNVLSLLPSLPSNEKFNIIMECKDVQVLAALGKYVFCCLNKRSSVVLNTDSQ